MKNKIMQPIIIPDDGIASSAVSCFSVTSKFNMSITDNFSVNLWLPTWM